MLVYHILETSPVKATETVCGLEILEMAVAISVLFWLETVYDSSSLASFISIGLMNILLARLSHKSILRHVRGIKCARATRSALPLLVLQCNFRRTNGPRKFWLVLPSRTVTLEQLSEMCHSKKRERLHMEFGIALMKLATLQWF